jgi:hypothetical protein
MIPRERDRAGAVFLEIKPGAHPNPKIRNG